MSRQSMNNAAAARIAAADRARNAEAIAAHRQEAATAAFWNSAEGRAIAARQAEEAAACGAALRALLNA